MVVQILSDFVSLLLLVFRVAIFVRIILSFFRPAYGTFLARIAEFATAVTEPLLAPIRRVMPATPGLDFSPLIALLLLQFVGSVLLRLIWRLPAI